ncbi:hypothetical protein ACOMHN_029022 [Nucella lapillus]
MSMMRARVRGHRWVDHPAAAVMKARVPGQWVDCPAAVVMEAREQGRCWIDHPAVEVMEARVQGRHWVDRPSVGHSDDGSGANCVGTPDDCDFPYEERSFWGWKNLNFNVSNESTEEHHQVAILKDDRDIGFLQTEYLCSTEGDTHCLTFDYQFHWMGERSSGEVGGVLRVFLNPVNKLEQNVVWVAKASQSGSSGWKKARVPIQVDETFVVDVSAHTDDHKGGKDDDGNDEMVPLAVSISVALCCGAVLIGLLVLAIVCYRRSSRKHGTKVQGCDSENTPGELTEAAGPRPPQVSESSAPDMVYSHLNHHRKGPPSQHAAQAQGAGLPAEDNYSHLTSATPVTSSVTSQSQGGDEADTEVEGILPAAPEVGVYHVLEREIPGNSAACPRAGDKGDYHHLNLGGRRGVGVEGEEEGGKVYDGLHGWEGDTYSHVQREGQSEKVIDGLYLHIQH